MREPSADASQRAGARRVAAALAALLLAALPLLMPWLAAPPAALLLREAAFGATVDGAATRPVTVPHRWAADCRDCGSAWYRFDPRHGTSGATGERQAVLLTGAVHNAAIFFNGELLAQGGRFSAPLARLGARPLWAVVPASAWSAHGNRLFVLVKAESPADGRIGSLAVGPEADLLWAWRWRVAWGQTLPQFVAVASGLLAAVMAAVWLRRRHEVGHAALAVACTAFALHAGSALWEEPPLGATAWDSWILLTAMALAGASLALATRLADAPLTRRAQAGLAALAALATIVGGLDAGLRAHAVAFAWLLLAICGLWLAGKGLRKGDGRLFAPGAALAVAGGFDALGIDPALPALPWAMAVLFAAAAWTLLMRFVETLNAAELLNIDLEALVQSRTAELRTQFERVAELERRQTVAAERERLMRDMHDGVGGHLVSLLAMIEGRERPPQELALAVRDALDDMRLVIDSLEPVDDDLNAVLAMWRDRLAPRLSQLGVTLDWDVELLPQLPGLTPARVLHVLRILQEAVTNAVRHGRAATVRVRAAADDAALHITLHDDGGGFDAAHGLGRGRGLTNMQRRAELAGAVLLLDSASGRGTTVSLRLPLRGLS